MHGTDISKTGHLTIFVSSFVLTVISVLVMENIALRIYAMMNNGWEQSHMWLLYVFRFCLSLTIFPFYLFVGWNFCFGRKVGLQMKSLPFVTVIIPAFNEQETVKRSIECALAQDYPEFEVIVVDDGSSDFTPLIIENPEVRSVHMSQNQGKATAVNQAISEARGKYILFSDSDSHLHKDAISNLLRHFSDPKIGASCGKLIVRRNHRLVVLWQSIEYIFSQALVKTAQVGSGSSITVCPGPICMYERKTLLEVGGFKDRTIVEDFDLTLEIARIGKYATYDPTAISWTTTPETFKALKNQRLRWYRGNLQALLLHKDMLFNMKYGFLGLFWLPYLLIFGFGSACLEGLMIILLVPSIFYYASWKFGMLTVILYGLFEVVNILMYVAVLGMERSMKMNLILAACIMKPYNLFQTWVRLLAMYREMRGERITWNG
ncbi:MAG: glycosyltransferase family 2 protein [Rickettsiales bacterium]